MQFELSQGVVLDVSDMHVGQGEEPKVELVVMRTKPDGSIYERTLISPVAATSLCDLADALTAFANATIAQTRFHSGHPGYRI